MSIELLRLRRKRLQRLSAIRAEIAARAWSARLTHAAWAALVQMAQEGYQLPPGASLNVHRRWQRVVMAAWKHEQAPGS